MKPLPGKAHWTDTQRRCTKKAKQCFLANSVRNSTSWPPSSVTMSKEITLLSEVISVSCAQKPFSSWTTWNTTSGSTSALSRMCAGLYKMLPKIKTSKPIFRESQYSNVRIFSTCGKNFTHLSHFYRHERIHTGSRPFSCSVCQKTFNQSSALKTHRKTHMKQKAMEHA